MCFLFFFKFNFLTLQYCIGFAIYRNESATGIHVFPILNPPPSSLPIPSLWVVPVHQPQASSILHRDWTGDSFHIWYYTYVNAILSETILEQRFFCFLFFFFNVLKCWNFAPAKSYSIIKRKFINHA